MRKLIYVISFSILIIQSSAQSLPEKTLKTEIKEVTVFLSGAQIIETGELDIPKGKSIVLIQSISPYMNSKSVQVKGKGNYTILSVTPKFNYLNRLTVDQKIDSLKTVIKAIDYSIATNENTIKIIHQKESLLNENKKIEYQNSTSSLTLLKQTLDFFDKELQLLKTQELKTNILISELKDQKKRLESQISQTKTKDVPPTGEIAIRVDATDQTTAKFEISYMVANAGWFPKYDLRVSSIDKPLELKYKADVFQNTGVDWKNIKLKLSNGDPNRSSVAPELRMWLLNYARNTIYTRNEIAANVRLVSGKVYDDYGDGLPGVNVVVQGTTIGTTTDLDGNYELVLPNGASVLNYTSVGMVSQEVAISSERMDIQMNADVKELQEVVVVGYASQGLAGSAPGIQIRGASSLNKMKSKQLVSTIVENQTTTEFEVEMPYSIASSGEKLTVDLNTHEVNAIYEYYVIPKLDKDAFLIAQIVDWDQYQLLEGEANLYFEDAYVGRSILDASSFSDTLSISMGRDKSILVERTKLEEFSKTRTVGLNKLDSRDFKILVKNKKSSPIKLTIFDQIPTAAISDISITPTRLSQGKLEDQSGKVTWEIKLKPQEQIELMFGYEVKYPKREVINLE